MRFLKPKFHKRQSVDSSLWNILINGDTEYEYSDGCDNKITIIYVKLSKQFQL